MNSEKISFETALQELKEAAEKIKSPGLNLEESIKCYEEGLKYYKICEEILRDTEQKIESVKVE